MDVTLEGLRRLLDRMAGPDIELVIECEPALPPARFDGSVFRRILIELVQTSSAGIADRGRILVRAEADRDRVLLTVADTGPGVFVDELPGVFTPFHERRRRSPTADAGLAAVHEIVVMNGADIRVASTPGGGARFSIYLPAWA